VPYREWIAERSGAMAWASAVEGAGGLVLPDGCMDLIWDGSCLFVAGPDTGPKPLDSWQPGTRFAGLRFEPGTGPAVLGIPADALRDERVALRELWPVAEVEAIEERARSLGDAAAIAAVLDAESSRRLGRTRPAPQVGAAVGLLAAGRPVAEVADAVGMSERQLHRRSLGWFGYGPKVLARILAAAATAGYADQAHLAREARALAGMTARQLAGGRSGRQGSEEVDAVA
jgi:AraC-like DNA-binding protein